MERIDPEQVSKLLWVEHTHRYRWAAGLARGKVLDAGCGAGYGSEILLAGQEVDSYLGVDYAADVIERARQSRGGAQTDFQVGDMTALPIPSTSVDTVVCIEVLEHLDHPERAIAEFARVLRPDGVLLGSVPSAEYDRACEVVYGPNLHHKTRFSHDAIQELLRLHFAHLRLLDASLEIFSVLRDPAAESALPIVREPGADWLPALGSILFAAGNDRLPALDEGLEGGARIHPAIGLIDHDAEIIAVHQRMIKERDEALAKQSQMIDQRDEALAKQTRMICERDAAIAGQTRLIDERDAAVAKLTRMIDERDEAIAAQTRLIDQRDDAIAAQTRLIDQRDEAIAAQTRLIDERDQALATQARMIEERDEAIAAQKRLINQRDEAIAVQTRLIDQRDEAIATQTRMIDERDELIRKQDAIVAARDAEIQRLTAEIEQLRESLRNTGYCLKMTGLSLIRPLVRRG